MSQSVYKVMGKNGRIYLPRELQNEMEIQRGDIIKLIPVKDGVQIKKVHLIEMGDKSPEAVEAFVHAAASAMSRDSQMELAARLLNSLREEEKQ